MGSSRGFSLVEIIVALSILSLALVPLMSGTRGEVAMNGAGLLSGRMALSAASALDRARLARSGPACLTVVGGTVNRNRVLLHTSAMPTAGRIDLAVSLSAVLPGQTLTDSLTVRLRCN